MKATLFLGLALTFWQVTTVAFPISRAQGGVSGGGGNVISPMAPQGARLDPSLVRKVILNTKPRLARYLAKKRRAYFEGHLGSDQAQAFGPLFEAPSSITGVMRSVAVDVEVNQPCYDADHVSYDGSTVSPSPHSICVSAMNLSEKVDASEMRAQSAALMLHEYGEVVGLTEAQAVNVQSQTLTELRGY